MENSKYYTPEISDFNIGLIYQCLCIDGDENDDECWNEFVFGEHDPIDIDCDGWSDNLLSFISEQKIRIKLLNKDDIIGLKWDDVALKPYHFEKKDGLYIYGLALLEKDRRVIIYEKINEMTSLIFNGILKNKSELRRLMKQLKIE